MTWRDKVPSLDLLSGRIYGDMAATNPARIALRRLMATKEAERASQRDRDYVSGALGSASA
jgi:hypothetical protein